MPIVVKVNTTSLSCQTGLRRQQQVKRETPGYCHQKAVDGITHGFDPAADLQWKSGRHETKTR